MGDCIVCALARPTLRLVDTAFTYEVNATKANHSDMACLVMSLDNLDNASSTWDTIYPVAYKNTIPPTFHPSVTSNVTCFINQNTATK